MQRMAAEALRRVILETRETMVEAEDIAINADMATTVFPRMQTEAEHITSMAGRAVTIRIASEEATPQGCRVEVSTPCSRNDSCRLW